MVGSADRELPAPQTVSAAGSQAPGRHQTNKQNWRHTAGRLCCPFRSSPLGTHTHVLVYVLLSQLNAEPCVLDGCWKHLFSFSKFLVHDLAHSPMPIILQHIRFTFWILWNHGSWEFNRKLLNCISLLYFIWKYYPFQAFFFNAFFLQAVETIKFVIIPHSSFHYGYVILESNSTLQNQARWHLLHDSKLGLIFFFLINMCSMFVMLGFS